MISALGEAWKNDRNALACRLGLLLYATVYTMFQAQRAVPSGFRGWFAVGVFVVGAALISIVLAIRINFRLRGVKKCMQCFVKNDRAATVCRTCGADFRLVSTEPFSPSTREVPYALRRERLAQAAFAASFVAAGAIAIQTPRNLDWSVGLPLWAALFIAYDLSSGLLLGRLQQELTQHDGCLCIYCAYPIDTSMARCPECGRACRALHAPDQWARAGMWFPHTLSTQPRDPGAAP